MKRLFILFFVLTLAVTKSHTQSSNETTTYYLIRHAEKDQSDKTNRDPHLIEKGLKRAEQWKNVLKNIKLDKIYSTNYYRTKETAQPIAKANNLDVLLYDPRNLKIEDFMAETKGENVLIVGHSNSTPMFVNALIGEQKYGPISEDNNANIFIVTVSGNTKSSTVLVVD